MKEEEQIVRASKIGAAEDIIHKSYADEGYDLRKNNPAMSNEKQVRDENI